MEALIMKRVRPRYGDGKGWARQNGDDIKFDENTGELIDQVTGERGTMILPEITISRSNPKNYRSSYDRAMVDEFVRLVDPTGVTSIPQVVKSGKELYNNPSYSNAIDFSLSLLSASPLVGKYTKYFKNIPGYKNIVNFLNIISSPIRMPIKALAKDNAVSELSKMVHLPGKNTRINAPILLSRLSTQSDPDIMYYGARNSSGEPLRAFVGDKFTGSYDYSIDRSNRQLARYADDAAYDGRDLVKTFVYGTDLPNKMQDSLGTRRYKGYIVPTINDTIYLDPSYKEVIDSLALNKSIIPYSEQFLNRNGDNRFGKYILDNVKRGLLKFNKSGELYYANLSDLWDLNNTTFFVGDMFLKRVEDNGGGPFYLEQNSPIKFTTDNRNDILPRVAPRLTLLRNNKITE